MSQNSQALTDAVQGVVTELQAVVGVAQSLETAIKNSSGGDPDLAAAAAKAVTDLNTATQNAKDAVAAIPAPTPAPATTPAATPPAA